MGHRRRGETEKRMQREKDEKEKTREGESTEIEGMKDDQFFPLMLLVE